MKLLILLVLLPFTALAERDCMKELDDFRLARKISTKWNSDLDWEKKSIAEICKYEEPDYDATMYVDRIVQKKAREELARKHTLTMGHDSEFYLEGLEGEVSHAEFCVEVDKYIKQNSDCTTPEAYLRSIKDFEYKDFEKMCLQKLPEQQKRMIACRKQK